MTTHSTFGFCEALRHVGLHPWNTLCKNWVPQSAELRAKYLPLESPPKLPATFNTPGGPADEIDQLKKRVAFLERELAGANDRYLRLDQVYNKLADQWSVFQATTRPDNRNIQRAEGAGEMARKLAEVLLSAAYGTDARDLLRKLLEDMEGESGRTVEVGGKLVKR